MPLHNPPVTDLMKGEYILPGYSYAGLPLSTPGAVTLTQSVLYLSPWYVPNACTLIRIGAEPSAATASSVLHLCIYADNGTFYPGDLVLSPASTVDGNSATVQELTISQALAPGVYWVGAVSQGAACTVRSIGGGGTTNRVGASVPGTGLTTRLAYSQASVTGALPPTFTSTVTTVGYGPRIFVKAS